MTTKTDNGTDVETDDEITTWTMVGLRNKRRRQGPTPRYSPAMKDTFYGTSGEEERSDDDNNEKGKNSDDANITTNINDDNNINNSGQDKNNDHQLSNRHI